MNRIRDINKANPRATNTFLNNLQDILWRQYEKTLLQEEVLWCQRARYKWLQLGDRNTSFFHASTIIKKKRNKVEALKDDDGNWVMEEEKLKIMVADYFRRLYSKDDLDEMSLFPLKGVFPKIDDSSLKNIERDITTEEIKDAIFSMGALKALRTGWFSCHLLPEPMGFNRRVSVQIYKGLL